MKRFAAVLLLLLIPAILSADTVILKDGSTKSGKAIQGPTVTVVRSDDGAIASVPNADVAAVIKGAVDDKKIYELLLKNAGEDLDAHEKLGAWCKKKKMEKEALQEFRLVFEARKKSAVGAADEKTKLQALAAWAKDHGLEKEQAALAEYLAGKTPDAKPPLASAATNPAAAPDPNAVTYMVIPIKGEIGKHMTAELFEKCIAIVEQKKPTYVVFYVDSPGGSCETAEQIITRFSQVKGIKTVAYIKSAISAAAIISLSCREIVMENSATIGGATAFAMTPFGLPEDISEKFQSIWRASCRTSAELGGHQSLIAEAMVDAQIELNIVDDENGHPVVKEGAGPRMLDRKGRLLTMTPKEAVECGLARHVTDDFTKLGLKLGVPDWQKMSDETETICEEYKVKIDAAVAELTKLNEDFVDTRDTITRTDSRTKQRPLVGKIVLVLKKIQKLGKDVPDLKLDARELDRAIKSWQDEYNNLGERRR